MNNCALDVHNKPEFLKIASRARAGHSYKDEA